jgi:hypothetical protein
LGGSAVFSSSRSDEAIAACRQSIAAGSVLTDSQRLQKTNLHRLQIKSTEIFRFPQIFMQINVVLA